jgi:hypothetical protein
MGGGMRELQFTTRRSGCGIRTRRERAEKLRKEQKAFFETHSEKARQVLDDIDQT